MTHDPCVSDVVEVLVGLGVDGDGATGGALNLGVGVGAVGCGVVLNKALPLWEKRLRLPVCRY